MDVRMILKVVAMIGAAFSPFFGGLLVLAIATFVYMLVDTV